MDIQAGKASKLGLLYLNYEHGTNFPVGQDDTLAQVKMIMEKKRKRNFQPFAIKSAIKADDLQEFCVEDDLGESDYEDGSDFVVRPARKTVGVQCNIVDPKLVESNRFVNQNPLQAVSTNKENWQSAKSIESSSRADTQEVEQQIPQKRSIDHPDFMSASDKLMLDNRKKNEQPKKRLGNRGFVSPMIRKETNESKPVPMNDDKLKNIDPVMVETIMNEIVSNVTQVSWDDIAGLEHAKATIKEIVVWPMLRPDIFNGIRGPPKGLLLFGPPGTGKTMIGKCIASQCNATFFSISSSSLTSKWVGDGEKMVRALFAVARAKQPSVIFVDEIDSLLTQRTDGEQEATRRIKTEFLVQFDGCGTSSEDRILMIGATNRPHEIDEAARRRFRKKLYVPLPEPEARSSIIRSLLSKQHHNLSNADICEIIEKTPGYSGSDMDGLIREAALGPIRDIVDISSISVEDVRPITKRDFLEALTQVRASVSERDLDLYKRFESEFGSVNRS
ncbi:hypothetical protein HK103_003046 [Boothiomyces macroporosus]|uniref:AAA+ ATPase domain-containing protein n=1 Tax=Boothiomyces macroporosus TaxID=261099 RepID=A0AAD5Y472_9FUNG|nr:hypothetical protein HK103_003046 [Boothiomyces macroporosus]